MAKEFVIKNGVIVNDTHAITGITNNSALTFNDSTLVTEKAIKEYVDELSQYISTGVVNNPTITQSGSSVVIGSSVVRIQPISDWTGRIYEYEISESTIALTSNSQNYLYVDYNGGNPIYQISTSPMANSSDKISVAAIWYNGINITYYYNDREALALANRINNRLISTDKFKRFTGLSLGESATRYVTMSSGTLYYGVHPYSLSSFNSSGDTMIFWYHVGGVWTSATTTQYDNTQYDNGTNLATLSNNRYVVNWIYREVGNTTPTVHMVLGSGDYTALQATDSKAPEPTSLPGLLRYQSYLAGRILVEKNATAAYRIDNSYDTSFSTSGSAPEQYANMRFVAQTGAEYNTIQGAIDSITDQSSTNRYVIYVYPGIYTENITMKPYITIVGISRLNGSIINGTVGNLVTLTGSTGEIGFRTMQFQLYPTTNGNNLIYSNSNNVTASFVDCTFTLSSSTNDISSSIANIIGSNMKLRLQRSILNYISNGTGTGSITHNVFMTSGTCYLDMQSTEINVTLQQNHNLNVFSLFAHNTINSILDQNHINVDINGSTFNKTVNCFNVVENDKIHIKYNNIYINNSNSLSGTSYIYNMYDGVIVNSTANRIENTNFTNNYYLNKNTTNSYISSEFDDVDTTSIVSGFTQNFNYNSSYSDGNFKNSGWIQIDSNTANTVLISDSNNRVVSSYITSTELGYLSGVSSNIQNQLNTISSTYVTTGTTQNISGYKTFTSGITISSNIPSTNTGTGSLIVTGGISTGDGLYAGGNGTFLGTLTLNNDVGSDTNIRFAVRGKSQFTSQANTTPIAEFGHSGGFNHLKFAGTSEGITLESAPAGFGASVETIGVFHMNSVNTNAIEFGTGIDRSARLAKSSGSVNSLVAIGRDAGNTNTTRTLFRVANRNATATLTLSATTNYFEVIDYNTTTSTRTEIFKIDYLKNVTISTSTTSTSPTSGALVVTGGIGIGGNIYTSGVISTSNSTTSTTPTTGALVVAGGLGVNENINANGVIKTINTTSSTSTSTGALIVSGGTGIGGSLYVGNLTGTATNLLGVDANGKIIDTGIAATQEDFDLIDFIILSGLTTGTTTVIPAKYKITSIVFQNNTGSSITISVGSTDNGVDIINTQVVGANSLQDGAIGTSLFSTTLSQIIYISSSNWVGSNVTIHIKIEKFTE